MRRFGDTCLLKLPCPWNPGQGSLKIIESDTIRYLAYGFLLPSYSNFVCKMHRFRDIRLLKLPCPWNPGQWSLKVIETDTIR